jgi:hypothetical protein
MMARRWSDEDRLSDLYAAILAAVGDASGYDHRLLTSHWPLVGRNFDQGIVVVGQAVYGWIPEWAPSQARTTSGINAIVEDSRRVFASNDDPMDWIDGHRVENSPFWRTAHQVVDALTPGSTPWYSRLAGANLYPVAPNDVKGNPEGPLREVQTGPAARFLDAVIEQLDPSLVLVLVGPFIWPFVGPLGLDGLARLDAPFTFGGLRRGRAWISGTHPGGAQRRGWPARAYAASIVDRVRAI